MSKLKIYSVYDSKIGAYMHPFFVRSRGEAIRMWIDTVTDDKTQFSKHPGDFTLMELGEYDEESGKFSNENTPISCGVAHEYIRKETTRPGLTQAPELVMEEKKVI